MKENVNTGENTSTESNRQGMVIQKREAGKKMMQVSVERKGSWQHSRHSVFPGHERLAPPNWDYPPPLGSPSDERRRQRGRCGEKLKETATEDRKDRKIKLESTSSRET